MDIAVISTENLRALIREEIRAVLDEIKPPDPFDDFPELLTRYQTAELLGVALATVDNWAKDGRLQKHKIGVAARFRKSEVVAAFSDLRPHSRR